MPTNLASNGPLVGGKLGSNGPTIIAMLILYYKTFFHHYQGSIDFNTVNINRTVGMYFLVSTGNRGDIE